MSASAALTVSIILLIANAWFVLFEFALVRIRATRLEELSDQGVRGAAHILKMHERMNDYLGACQMGITIASLGIGWLAEPALAGMLEPVFGDGAHTAAIAIAFTVMTLAHIILGEQVPKAVAIQVPERALLWSVTPMRVFYTVFLLPLRALNALTSGLLWLLRLPPGAHNEPSLSTEEIRLVVADAYRQGEVSLDRSLLLENALDFGVLTVSAVMVPMSRAEGLDIKMSRQEVLEIVAQRRLSRYLLTDGGEVIGYVHVKDILIGDEPLIEVRRKLLAVTGDTPLDRVLRAMQRERTQIALISDATGAHIGMVTLEDVLEELVGEIHDEFEEVKVWNLADHVVAGAAQVDAPLINRDDAIHAMCDVIATTTHHVTTDAAVKGVLKREAQGPTDLGSEVAIPHARIPGLPRTYVAIARLADPMKWRRDGEPVRFVFLILTPAEHPIEQSRALMRVARLVRDEVLFARLAEAPSPEAMLEVVRAADVVS